MKSASLSVHHFALITQKTITSINLKFGGKVFHGVQTDSSKFGVICLKIKARRVFFVFLIGNTQCTASLHHVPKKINILLSHDIITQ